MFACGALVHPGQSVGDSLVLHLFCGKFQAALDGVNQPQRAYFTIELAEEG